MAKQALIIGLGQFGMALARTLSERGVDVLGVDIDPTLVQIASAFVDEAACFDAMDEEALARTAPQRRDLCVCSIGSEARDAAIIVTAQLKQMGARRILARATDDVTERILRLVGADQTVNPEREIGERLAKRIVYEGIVDEIPLGPDLVITELRPPKAMVGRSLMELALPKRFNVTVVAIRRNEGGAGKVILPNPQEPIRADDILVIVSASADINRLVERL
jgi:trk system potassium uptake protein